MSHEALCWAFHAVAGGRVPPTASYVLLTLAHIHTRRNGCRVGREALCARLGLSESALRRALTQLVKAGLVDLGRRQRDRRTYHLKHGKEYMP